MAGKGAAEVVNPKASDEDHEHHLAKGVGASGGALAGAAAGAPGGPVGMAAGAAIGAVAGGLAGKGAAKVVNPVEEDRYWSGAYRRTSYYDSRLAFDDYRPAYGLGYNARGANTGTFEQAEAQLSRDWNAAKGASRLTWEQARFAARDAWDRATD
jgi:uncharacterized protein YcfJ